MVYFSYFQKSPICSYSHNFSCQRFDFKLLHPLSRAPGALQIVLSFRKVLFTLLTKAMDQENSFSLLNFHSDLKILRTLSPENEIKSASNTTLELSRRQPVILHPTIFDFSAENIIPIAQAAYDLLSFVVRFPKLTQAYALEFVPHENKWQMRIRLDVKSWAKTVPVSGDDLRAYREELCDQIRVEEKEYGNVGYVYENSDDTFRPSGDVCQARIRGIVCGQYLREDLRLQRLEKELDPNYVVLCRAELLREVLLMPFPGEVQHYTNFNIAKMPSFWEEVLDFVHRVQLLTSSDAFPIDSYVAFHFGKWESMTSANPRLRDCHAHVHLSLSLNAHQSISETESILEARTQSARLRYWEEDLEAVDALLLFHNVADLQKSIKDIHTMLSQFTKQ